MSGKLKIKEFFLSIQGEGLHQGLPCFFIRTSGCDLRCRWCDTEYAFTGGEKYTAEEIISRIPDRVDLIQITGGEPLLQEAAVIELIEKIPREKTILLETGGHRSIERIPEKVHIVLDVKLPSSGEEDHDFSHNFSYLKKTDEIKFVVGSLEDLEYARGIIKRYDLENAANILFSPVFNQIDLKEMAEWFLKSGIHARMQVQLHKIIWGNQQGV